MKCFVSALVVSRTHCGLHITTPTVSDEAAKVPSHYAMPCCPFTSVELPETSAQEACKRRRGVSDLFLYILGNILWTNQRTFKPREVSLHTFSM